MSMKTNAAQTESLARRMAGMDEAAYGDFADRFGPQFRAFFLSSHLSHFDAEDLAVTCVTDVAINITHYRFVREGGFESWVWSIVRRKLADWRREQMKSMSLQPVSTTEFQAQGEDHNDYLVQAVDNALGDLPPADEALIRLRYFGGEYTFNEIGQKLGLSGTNARLRHFRICKRLSTLFGAAQRVLRSQVNRVSPNDLESQK